MVGWRLAAKLRCYSAQWQHPGEKQGPGAFSAYSVAALEALTNRCSLYLLIQDIFFCHGKLAMRKEDKGNILQMGGCWSMQRSANISQGAKAKLWRNRHPLCCGVTLLLRMQAFSTLFTTDPRDRDSWISKITGDASLGTFRHLPAQHSPMWTPLQALQCSSARSRLSFHLESLGPSKPRCLLGHVPGANFPVDPSLRCLSWDRLYLGCCSMAVLISLIDFSKAGVWSTPIAMLGQARRLDIVCLLW